MIKHSEKGALESVNSIPIIDFQPYLRGTSTDREQVAELIREASETVGFYYLINHGVSRASTDRIFRAAQTFFNSSPSIKESVQIKDSHRGYIPLGTTARPGAMPEINESFVLGVENTHQLHGLYGINRWPPSMMEFRYAALQYLKEICEFGQQLTRACSLALDLPAEYFDKFFEPPMPTMRLLHYPSTTMTEDADRFGIDEHTDFGFLTILAQDQVGGLQVKKRNGDRIEGKYIEGALIINIGDMLQRWTNDRWISTPHRVINRSGKERFSVPVFFDPNYETIIQCIESCRLENQPANWAPIKYGSYLEERFSKIYDYRKKELIGE